MRRAPASRRSWRSTRAPSGLSPAAHGVRRSLVVVRHVEGHDLPAAEPSTVLPRHHGGVAPTGDAVVLGTGEEELLELPSGQSHAPAVGFSAKAGEIGRAVVTIGVRSARAATLP